MGEVRVFQEYCREISSFELRSVTWIFLVYVERKIEKIEHLDLKMNVNVRFLS